MKKSKIFYWIYIVYSFIIPSALVLYVTLFEKLFDKNVRNGVKLSLVAIVSLVAIGLIALIYFAKSFQKRINKMQVENDKLTDEIFNCKEEDKKNELLEKKGKLRLKINKIMARRELFGNILFITPIIVGYIVIALVEKGIVSLRGTFLALSISVLIGFIFHYLSKKYEIKE